jgi:hypothetical protein
VSWCVSSPARLRLFFIPLWWQTQSRSETRYRHTLDAALTIYRSEGIRAFYRGLLPSLLGITHVAVQFPLYEKLKIVARAIPFSLPLIAHLKLPQNVTALTGPCRPTLYCFALRSQR